MTKNIIFSAFGKAAKIYGVSTNDLVKYHKDFGSAPAELKRPLLLGYKILRNYQKTPAVDTAEA